FNPAGLSARERQLVEKLVEASRYLDDIYWRQSDPEGLALYKSTPDPKLKRLLMINGSRWDLLDENRPFVGTEPMPPGHALYPKDLRGRSWSSTSSSIRTRKTSFTAAQQWCAARVRIWSRRPIMSSTSSSWFRQRRRCAMRLLSATMRRSPTSCALEPTRSYPTIIIRAIWFGST